MVGQTSSYSIRADSSTRVAWIAGFVAGGTNEGFGTDGTTVGFVADGTFGFVTLAAAAGFVALDRIAGCVPVTLAPALAPSARSVASAGGRTRIAGLAPPAILASGGAAIARELPALSPTRRGMERSFEESFGEFILVAMRHSSEDHASASGCDDSGDVGVNAAAAREEPR